MDEISKRILEVRKQENLTQEKFGERLGVSRSVIKNIEYGATVPNPLFLKMLSKEYSIDLNWLETGEGEMYVRPSDTQEKLADIVGAILRPDTDERKKEMVLALITKIYELPDELLPEVHKFAQSIADASAEKEKDGG